MRSFRKGTMNFYGHCAGLPLKPATLAEYMQRCETRASPLIRVKTEAIAQGEPKASFEAVHIGPMAYWVVQGANDWRMSLGPMFGIFLNLISRNLFPKDNIHHGNVTLTRILTHSNK